MFGLPLTSTKHSKQTPIIQNAERNAPVSVCRKASPEWESIAAANVEVEEETIQNYSIYSRGNRQAVIIQSKAFVDDDADLMRYACTGQLSAQYIFNLICAWFSVVLSLAILRSCCEIGEVATSASGYFFAIVLWTKLSTMQY